MDIEIGQRVKLNANGSWMIPKVVEIKDDELVLQRRKKGREIGKLTIAKYRFEKLSKPFRGAKYECTIKAKI